MTTTSQRRSIVSFVRNNYRTKDQLLNPISEKDKMRLLLAKFMLRAYKNKSMHVLNLPSVWWNFEKTLTCLAPKYNVKLSFNGCEHDTEAFLCSAKRMPRNTDYNIVHNKKLNITSAVSENALLVNMDIFDFIEEYTSFSYDVIWLDLMCHVNTFVDRLPVIDWALRKNGYVTITYAAGRDSLPIIGSREDIIIDRLVPLGYEIINQGRYLDGFPMRYMTLYKL